jgi:hypothetical protein
MFTQSLFTLASVASSVLAAPYLHPHPHANAVRAELKCPIVFDGRVPVNTTPTFFDSASTNTIFNADFVKGNNLTCSRL